MAVIEYKEGQHGGGFVGFRVARTIGSNKDYRQKYFSIKKYADKAFDLANDMDAKWKAMAKFKKLNLKPLIFETQIKNTFLQLDSKLK